MKTQEQGQLVTLLKTDTNVWVGSRMGAGTRWICGAVGALGQRALRLRRASWIDHTGGWWSSALLEEGAGGKGWSSEYQADTILPLGSVSEILFMGETATLPEKSVRPNSPLCKKPPPHGKSLRQEGRSGLFVRVGENVWVSAGGHRWICGRVKAESEHGLLLEQCSHIVHTGGFWSDVLLFDGCRAEEWSSEYQGDTVVSRETLTEIIPMGLSAPLPEQSYRHEKNYGEDAGNEPVDPARLTGADREPGSSGLFLSEGDRVMIQLGSPHYDKEGKHKVRKVWGRVGQCDEDTVLLTQCSWALDEGEYWATVITKGARSEGWRSEYQGTAILPTRSITEIVFLPETAALPTESVRPVTES